MWYTNAPISMLKEVKEQEIRMVPVCSLEMLTEPIIVELVNDVKKHISKIAQHIRVPRLLDTIPRFSVDECYGR